ncbi:MAG: secreted protein [Hydrocarboniphaga sp.]|uniref:hypothetical protein n=1 Tax=Hydrocarboniphaga sp. TaxID=2033016 RepID=UPI00262527CA|nr:hypothetical protein [Hydrocarboniphaga sp.]MDB5967779.1 secreted protein [Hydrocarboniphaga sp.]
MRTTIRTIIKTFFRLGGAAVLAVASTTIFAAGGTVALQTFDADGNGVDVVIETLDSQHMRLSSPQHQEAYLVMLGAKTYNVLQFGSLPIVMDTADMLSQMGGQMPSAPSPSDDIHKLVALEATGKKETVAGVVGDVQLLRFLDSRNQPRVEELVTVRDPLLHDISFGLYRLGTVMGAAAGITTPEGSDKLARELDAKGLGILRMGNRMRLISVNRATPPANVFDLPAEPMRAFPPLN